MSTTYDNFVTQLSNLIVISSGDSNFTTMLPFFIDYAEQRIYRDIDLLYTQITDATASVSSGNRNLTLPSTFITVDQINIITPSTALSSNGTRNPVTPASREFIDSVYPSGQAITGVPLFYAMASNTEVIFGPAPAAAYRAEIIGEQRPAALSSANSSTILTQYIPDVFMAAAMVAATAWLKDYGAQTDDPRSAQSWENQYQTLMQSAAVEQFRSAHVSQGWTSKSPNPIATPQRK